MAGAVVAKKVARPLLPAPSLGAGDVLRVPRAFSRSECATLIDLARGQVRHADQFLYSGEVRGASEVYWLKIKLAPEWLIGRINSLFADAALQFGFDVSGPLEDLKLMKYRRNNRVAWHVDCGGGETRTRKLTLTVLLSAPDSFSGGALTVAGDTAELHRDIGDVVIFPAFLAHKVTTVLSGTRHTMIAWAHGTPFR